MNKSFKKTLLGLCLMNTLVLTACNDDNDRYVSEGDKPLEQPILTDCMWQEGPTSKSNTGADPMNFAYPDTNVNYWSSEFTIPEGAKVYVDGDYPYARHSSLVSYTAEGERVNSLRDFEIEPKAGVVNPFVVGNNRINQARGYQAEIKLGNLPEKIEKNTLYAPKTDTNEVAVLYRVYVPNEGLDAKAGVSFPRYSVVLANGEVKKGEDVCNVLKVKKRSIQNVNAPPEYLMVYDKLRPVFGTGYPARQTPKWFKTFNAVDNFLCIFQAYPDGKPCEGRTPQSIMNQWATPDNEYVVAATSRELGKIVVLQGKLPSTTQTYKNNLVVNNSDMRYWSVCTNEMYTSATNHCLYDEQIKTDANGFYTIVVANPEDRPNNAIAECNINYLEQSARGDGYSQAVAGDGHTDLGMLLIRNLLPNDTFEHTIQKVKTSGDEKLIMGDYAPEISYTSREAFESLGCNK